MKIYFQCMTCKNVLTLLNVEIGTDIHKLLIGNGWRKVDGGYLCPTCGVNHD